MACMRRIAYRATDEQDPGHQPGDRGRGLGVGVGQPAVHRGQAGLGGEAEDGQGDGDPGQVGVQGDRAAGQCAPGQGRCAGGHRGGVEQDDAEERDRDPDRAEDDVLPGGLERAAGAVVADEEGGGDGGGLDRDPQDAEVVAEDGQAHRGQEQADQGGVAAVRGGLGGPGRQPAPQCGDRDRADGDQQPGRQRVGAQRTAAGDDRAVGVHGCQQAQAGGQHHDRHGQVSGAGPAAAWRHQAASAVSSGTSRGIQSRAVISRATPSGRRGRCRRARTGSGRSAPAGSGPPAARRG